MAVKTANVTARIQPNIKEQAEAILDRLGIPVSVFIDMTYRQVITTCHNSPDRSTDRLLCVTVYHFH